MNLSLNPKAFDRPLRFEWFDSEEGESWDFVLRSLMQEVSESSFEVSFVEDRVAETLEKIGVQKLQRHLEIKPIAQGIDLGLVELRWNFLQLPTNLKLRFYCCLVPDKALLVGLCFRRKRILETKPATKSAQNHDILEAINLAKIFAEREIF